MAAIGLSVKEIAAVLGCSHDTIARRFKHQLDSGWENMRASLKRAQYEAAVKKGNTTMLIWLGKQHLGQSDNPRPADGQNPELAALTAALMAGPKD